MILPQRVYRPMVRVHAHDGGSFSVTKSVIRYWLITTGNLYAHLNPHNAKGLGEFKVPLAEVFAELEEAMAEADRLAQLTIAGLQEACNRLTAKADVTDLTEIYNSLNAPPT